MASKFIGTVYKIDKVVNDLKDFEFTVKNQDPFIVGFDSNDGLPIDLVNKLNKGIKKLGAPWKTCIPLYRKSFFVFYSSVALQTFLFTLCELTETDLKTLNECGYILYEFNVDNIASGYSIMRGTVDLDSVFSYNEIPFDSFVGKFNPVIEVKASSESINYTKTSYYNKFKLKI